MFQNPTFSLLQPASFWQGMQQLSSAKWLLQLCAPVPLLSASCTQPYVNSLQRQVSHNPLSSSSRCLTSRAGNDLQPNSKVAGNSSSQVSRGPSLKQLRAEIFEQHIGDGRRSGRKAILKPLKGRVIADWYFTLTGPKMHLFDEPLEEERMMKVQMARATGTGPPKKGQGKRAGKRK